MEGLLDSQTGSASCLKTVKWVKQNWKGVALVIFVILSLYFLYNSYNIIRLIPTVSPVINTIKPVLPWGGNFSYDLSPDKVCSTPPTLLIVVISTPDHTDSRQVIRKTWGSIVTSPSDRVSLVFLLGNSTKIVGKQLHDEQRVHNDIIVANFEDSYRNLTVKSIAMLHWVSTNCPTTQYLLKADDDMFINVPNLLAKLRNTSAKRFIMGLVFKGAAPILDKASKWYTPDFQFDKYPDYVSGTAYVISGDVIESLYHVAIGTPLFWLEDVFITGICSPAAGAVLIGDNAFSCVRRPLTWCAFKNTISGHGYTAEEIMQIWEDFQEENHSQC